MKSLIVISARKNNKYPDSLTKLIYLATWCKRGEDSAIKPRKDMTHQEEAANRNCFKVVVFKFIQLLEFGQKLDIMQEQ